MSNPTFTFPQMDPTTVTPPPAGAVGLVANLLGQLTVILSNGTIVPLFYNNILSTQLLNSSSAGANVVGPGNGYLTAVVNVTGGSGVRQFLLSTVGLTGAQAGSRIKILFNFQGQASGIELQVYNSNSSGAKLFDWTTDGVQGDAVADFYLDATGNWQIDEAQIPATT